MNTLHTPGPWQWDGPVWGYDSKRDAPWLTSIATNTRVLSGQIRCQSKEDATLIAAAPELLHVVTLAYYVMSNIDNQFRGRHTEAGQALLSGMRDTIAKATGLSAEEVQDGSV